MDKTSRVVFNVIKCTFELSKKEKKKLLIHESLSQYDKFISENKYYLIFNKKEIFYSPYGEYIKNIESLYENASLKRIKKEYYDCNYVKHTLLDYCDIEYYVDRTTDIKKLIKLIQDIPEYFYLVYINTGGKNSTFQLIDYVINIRSTIYDYNLFWLINTGMIPSNYPNIYKVYKRVILFIGQYYELYLMYNDKYKTHVDTCTIRQVCKSMEIISLLCKPIFNGCMYKIRKSPIYDWNVLRIIRKLL